MTSPSARLNGRFTFTACLTIVCAMPMTGCDVFESYRYCSMPDPTRMAALPQHLSETGLFSDIRNDIVMPGIAAYRPSFELWSDQATKRRWIFLPSSSRIDSSDMDNWQFPVGTKLWKEFSRDGIRVETRLLQRTGPAQDDWAAISYLWNDDGADAVAVPDGVTEARGTSHVVPSAQECMGCHGGRPSRVLGFSAIQLSHDDPAEMLTVDQLVKKDLLSAPPAGRFEVPGSPEAAAALGYLHANCSHCHNQERPPQAGSRCFDPEKKFDFLLRTGELASVDQTATYRTAIGSVIKKGDPGHSPAVHRMSNRDRFPPSMPPLGTKRVDDNGLALVRAWIQGL